MAAAFALASFGHEVTIVEKSDRLGGHAHTWRFEDGSSADPAFGAFSRSGYYPNTYALWERLGVEVYTPSLRDGTPATINNTQTFFSTDQGEKYASYVDLIEGRRLQREVTRWHRDLYKIPGNLRYADTSIGQYFAEEGYTAEFVESWFLNSAFGFFPGMRVRTYLEMPIEPLSWFFALNTANANASFQLLCGGADEYVRRFRARLDMLGVRTVLRSTVLAVERTDQNVSLLISAAGDASAAPRPEPFDHLVLATQPEHVSKILGPTCTAGEREVLEPMKSLRSAPLMYVRPDSELMGHLENAGCYHYDIPLRGQEGNLDRIKQQFICRPSNEDPRRIVPMGMGFDAADGVVGEAQAKLMPHALPTFAIARGRKRVAEELQGTRRTWYAGSWMEGFSIHDDAIVAGLRAANGIMAGRDEYPILEKDLSWNRRITRKAPAGTDGFTTLVDVIEHRARHDADRTGYVFVDDDGREQAKLSYAELERCSREVAALLHWDHKLARNDRVVLLYPPGVQFFVAMLGCIRLGIIPVPSIAPDPLDPLPGLAKLNKIVDDCGAAAVLTTQVGHAAASATQELFPWPSLPWIVTDGPTPESVDALEWPQLSPDDIAFIQYTSGSTSAPKGVMVSHRNVLEQNRMGTEMFGWDTRSVAVEWIPQYHDLGLINMFVTMYTGGLWVFMAPMSFLKQPALWGELIHRYRATSVCGPDFGYALMMRKTTPEQRARWDWSALQHVVSGAEPVRHATMESFARAFECTGLTEEKLYASYGLAEHTLLGTFKGRDRYHCDKTRLEVGQPVPYGTDCLVGSGTPHLDVDLKIVHPETCEMLPDLVVGEVWLNSTSKAMGYWNKPDETERTFRARIARHGGEYLRTGDVGFVHQDELFVIGRISDRMIFRGANIHASDVEDTVCAASPELRPGCCAVFSVDREEREAMVTVAELRNQETTRTDEIVGAIRTSVARQHGQSVDTVVLIPPKSIPKTSSGKIQRNLCRQLWQKGSLPVVHEDRAQTAPPVLPLTHAAPASVREALEHTLADIVQLQSYDLDRPLAEQVPIDSLKTAELVNTLNQRLSVDITLREATALAGRGALRDLFDYVDQHGRLVQPEDLEARSIVPVRTPAGDGPSSFPVFCVYPIEGSLLWVNRIAENLPGVPLFAFRPVADAPYDSIPAMASDYIRQMQIVSPGGPWILAGYSFGVGVAAEMAQQLRKSGLCAGVIAFDAPQCTPELPWYHALCLILSYLEAWLGREEESGMRRVLEEAPQMPIEAVIEQLRRVTVARCHEYLPVLVRNSRAAFPYFNSGVRFDCGCESVCFATSYFLDHHGSRDVYVFDEYVPVPGDHRTLFEPEHQAAWIAKLRRQLERMTRRYQERMRPRDALEIQNLFYRCTERTDARDLAEVQSCFRSDATFSFYHGSPERPEHVMHGARYIADYTTGRLRAASSLATAPRHHLSIVQFEALEPTKAHTRTSWTLTVLLTIPDTGARTIKVVATGEYLDELTRTVEGWKIAERRVMSDVSVDDMARPTLI